MPTLLSFANFRRLLLFLTGIIALLLLVEAVKFLPVTDENVHTESAYIVSAQRWAQGLPLYSDFRKPPYLITPFPPLWYAFLLLAQRLGVTGIDSLTLFARLLSFVSLLGIGLFLYLWNRRRGLGRGTSLLSCTSFVAIPLLIPMAVIARQDLPALFVSLLAIFIATRSPSYFASSAAGGVAAAAFLIKHSSLGAPLTIGIWLLYCRRWKHFLFFSGIWGVIVFPTMVYFQISSGHAMMMNLSGSKFGPFSIKNLHDILIHLMTVSGAQIMLALFALALCGFLRANSDERDSILKIYFVISLVLALFACGFANATANHFLEPVMVWAMLVPVAIESLRHHWNDSATQSGLIFALLLVLLLPTFDVQLWSTRNQKPDDVRLTRRLVAGKRILTDVSYLGARSANPGFLDPISLTFSEKAGAWSSKEIVDQIRSRGYELVILHWDLNDPRWRTIRYVRLPAAMRMAIAENYAFCFEFDSDFVYAPKKNGQDSVVCPARPSASPPL